MTFVGVFDILTVAGCVAIIIGAVLIVIKTVRKMRHGTPKVGRHKAE